MRLIIDRSEAVAAWAARQFGGGLAQRGFGPCSAIGVATESGGLLGALVCNNWDPDRGAIEATAVSISRRWMRPSVLTKMLWHIFDGIGCGVVVCRIDPDNTSSLRWLRALGGLCVRVPNLGGAGADLMICTLTRDDYLNSAIGRRYGIVAITA